ncbi:hypothetical protein DXX93_17920 [Thalassotalea euphylliae]|uniref:Uncharacterized protein n=1 Tax=Thalassotalea euphylliae TaxID=1655234 RepID=A0A3E0TUW5_9GAMM|nr:hypothetical protein [Thalassotalea euphylliae]REL28259.1 hypothetical protein DXX93_17920 [Thalassotalea euphylliae]
MVLLRVQIDWRGNLVVTAGRINAIKTKDFFQKLTNQWLRLGRLLSAHGIDIVLEQQTKMPRNTITESRLLSPLKKQ